MWTSEDVYQALGFLQKPAKFKSDNQGDWILLDEVNMADSDVLECLAEIMNVKVNKLCLYGGGMCRHIWRWKIHFSTHLEYFAGTVIEKHPDFRVFACMNPATDVGKKDLPEGLRNR